MSDGFKDTRLAVKGRYIMTVGTDKMGVVMNTCIFDLMGKWPVYGLATYIVAFVFIFLFCACACPASLTARADDQNPPSGNFCL